MPSRTFSEKSDRLITEKEAAKLLGPSTSWMQPACNPVRCRECRSLCEKLAAPFLGVSVSWLQKARGKGTGPRYAKIGRKVIYRECVLLDFIRESFRTSTSDNGNYNGRSE